MIQFAKLCLQCDPQCLMDRSLECAEYPGCKAKQNEPECALLNEKTPLPPKRLHTIIKEKTGWLSQITERLAMRNA